MKKAILIAVLASAAVAVQALDATQTAAIRKLIDKTPPPELPAVMKKVLHDAKPADRKPILDLVAKQRPAVRPLIDDPSQPPVVPAENRPPVTPGNDHGNRPTVPPGLANNYGSP